MRGLLKKALFAVTAAGLAGVAGCAVYVPGPVVRGPGFVVGPAPVVVYPYHYGYYGYYGWHRGYWR